MVVVSARHLKMKLCRYIKELGGDVDSIRNWQVFPTSTTTALTNPIYCDTGEKILNSYDEVGKHLGLLVDDIESKEKVKRKVKNKKNTKKGREHAKTKNNSAPSGGTLKDFPGDKNRKKKRKHKHDEDMESLSRNKKRMKKNENKDSIGLERWQVDKIKRSPLSILQHVQEYIKTGATVFRNVLTQEQIHQLLHGLNVDDSPPPQGGPFQGQMVMRKRKGNQKWMGAIRTINALIKKKGSTETVLSPLTTRQNGRYDMPLPMEARIPIQSQLEKIGILPFAQYICRTGKIRTQDIMLSRPGSSQQQVHTDSAWDDMEEELNPKTTYLTILIPLTVQDKKTGGTRVWPKSHRTLKVEQWDKPIDMIDPQLCVGDALVFDGLLSHCGMANIDRKRDRYFYYAAFATGHDPNTEVTGS